MYFLKNKNLTFSNTLADQFAKHGDDIFFALKTTKRRIVNEFNTILLQNLNIPHLNYQNKILNWESTKKTFTK